VPIYLPDYAGAKLPKYSAFAVEDPRAWKSLPPALRSTSKSFSSFKKHKIGAVGENRTQYPLISMPAF